MGSKSFDEKTDKVKMGTGQILTLPDKGGGGIWGVLTLAGLTAVKDSTFYLSGLPLLLIKNIQLL